MDKDAMIQAAEEEWLAWADWMNREQANWHWFWLILAESIWPEEILSDEDFKIHLDILAAEIGD